MKATIAALFEVSWAVARDEKPHGQREALTVATTAKRKQNSRFFAHNRRSVRPIVAGFATRVQAAEFARIGETETNPRSSN
jgi:hypothetical protein